LILNGDAVGYYRSVVDPAMARALLTPSSPSARAAKSTPAERMMLVEDLRAAVDRGEIELDRMLPLVPLIAADPDDKVARSAVFAVDLPLGGVDDAMYRAGIAWYQKAFGGRARQLGWLRGPHDSEERHELRQVLVGSAAIEDPKLSAEAARLADRWLADRSGITDDLVGSVLRVSAYHGDMARFERYLAAAKAARDRTEHGRLLGTLGGFIDPAIARRGLALVLGHDLDLRDSLGILYGVLSHRETRDLALDWLTEHLDELLARMRDDEASGLLGGLAGRFCDRARRDRIASLVTQRAAKYDGAQTPVTRGLEQAVHCIARVERELPALRRVLGVK
jgi:ERAP1-like protein